MRLIDADKIQGDYFLEIHSNYIDDYAKGFQAGLNVVSNAPTINAVPVVRCKDCKFWKKQRDSLQGRCILMDHCSAGEWYCWNGELKEV